MSQEAEFMSHFKQPQDATTTTTTPILRSFSIWHTDDTKQLAIIRGYEGEKTRNKSVKVSIQECLDLVREAIDTTVTPFNICMNHFNRDVQSSARLRIGTQLKQKRKLPKEMVDNYMMAITSWISMLGCIPVEKPVWDYGRLDAAIGEDIFKLVPKTAVRGAPVKKRKQMEIPTRVESLEESSMVAYYYDSDGEEQVAV